MAAHTATPSPSSRRTSANNINGTVAFKSTCATSGIHLRSPMMWSAVAGLLAAAAYALSPITVIAAVLAALLLRVAGRGLPSGERRRLAALLLVALALRAVVVGAIFLTAPHDDQALAVL